MSQLRHLPVIDDEPISSLRKDGRRNFVHPADVSGRFTNRRTIVFAVLLVVYLFLPFIEVSGRPAIFLDVLNRQFYLFGASFNATDFWLVFFLLTGIGFTLIVVTTLWGRVWCGYACPQTVFLEGIYRKVERLIEGPRAERMRRNAGPLTGEKLAKKTLKHALFFLVSVLIAHVFLSYFVSLPALARMVRSSPSDHPEAFAWVSGMTLVMYGNFAWFREQLCLIICPYGRLQSAMTDSDTLVIGYDKTRGEPRGKASDPNAGDCIDCKRCVQVCPTGIDIRNGLQIECIGCAACVDACDEVMLKVDRAPGLVRYDSSKGFEGKERKRLLRPRVYFYAFMGVVGLAVASVSLASRTAFEAHLLRAAGLPFTTTETEVLNPMRLHLINKSSETTVLHLEATGGDAVHVDIPGEVRLGRQESRYVPMMVRVAREDMRGEVRARVRITREGSDERPVIVDLPVLGPRAR